MTVSLPSYALKWAPGDGPELMGLLHTPLDVMEMIADKIASPGITTSCSDGSFAAAAGRQEKWKKRTSRRTENKIGSVLLHVHRDRKDY